MHRVVINNFNYLQFAQLEIPHGTLLGHNVLCLHPNEVRSVASILSQVFNNKKLISAHQVHGTRILIVDEKTPRRIFGYDALITNKKGIVLMVSHADCQGTLFYDPMQKVIAAVHCGWRGNVQNIYKKTVETLKRVYGSHPEDLLVCIGPSLGPKYSQFIHYRLEWPQEFWSFANGEYFDLWQISRWQLEEANVKPEHIEIAGICTYSQKGDFYSYRRQTHMHGKQPLKGANGSFIALA